MYFKRMAVNITDQICLLDEFSSKPHWSIYASFPT
jgi:hypothetical protein